MIHLYDAPDHVNLMVHDLSQGSMVQANQHIIIDNEEAIVLDPGGHKVYTKLFAQISSHVKIKKLRYIFFSHQDPDIIAATNGWLMVTDAEAFLSELWLRFIPHFGVDELVVNRIHGIPDEGMTINLGKTTLQLLPAHFLHSAGNFQLFDPISKILYSGDLGASLGCSYQIVTDFNEHIHYMEGFHKRYIPTGKVLKNWANMIDNMDIETIAPQHGAILQGKELSLKFKEWVRTLDVGIDIMPAFTY